MLAFQPVLYHCFTVWGKDGFGVELNAVYVQCPVPQCHDMAFLTDGSDFQAVGKGFRGYDPGVIPSDRKFIGEGAEEAVVCNASYPTLYAVVDLLQIDQFASEGFGDGLFSQTDSQYRFLPE